MTETQKPATPPRCNKKLVRQSLESIGGIIAETAKIYREMKASKRDHKEGRSLVWVLSELRAMVEAKHLEAIEARLAEMEGAAARGFGHGHTGTGHAISRPH